MANTGMTQKEIFTLIKEEMADNAEVVAFCDRKIAQLSKPRSNKPNKAVLEFRADLVDFLRDADEAMTNKEIAEGMEVTPQKVANNLKRLVEDGVVVRIEGEKAKEAARFVLAEEDAEVA